MVRRVVGLLCLSLGLAPPVTMGAQQLRTVVGKVVRSNDGQPVLGATVTQVGAPGRGTFGDGQGRFRLQVTAGPVFLHVRAIGYLAKDVPVPDADTAVTVALVPDALKLEQVVITGTATTVNRRSAPTSDVGIDSADLTRAPAQTVDQELQGKVAGARLETNSGAPGGGVQIQIRGVSTVIGGSDPLFVVDGVIYSNASIPTGLFQATGSGSNNGTGPTQDDASNRLADLNPDDIESIQVLKSAAAASIYGSKAANGVIIITTKRGKAGKPRTTVTQRTGFSHLLRGPVSRRFTVAEADSAYGVGTVAPYIVNGQLPFHDHLTEIAGRTPINSQTLVDVQGGNDNTRYYLSGGFTQDGGILLNSGAQRQSLRGNVDQHLGRDLDATLTTNFTHTYENRGFANNDNNGASAVYAIAYIPSFIPITPTAPGQYPQPGITYKGANPLQTLDASVNNDQVTRFNGGTSITWVPVHTESQSLKFVANGGLDFFSEVGTVTVPAFVFFQANQTLPGVSVLANASSHMYNWNLNALHTYTAPHNLFKAATTGGIEFEDNMLGVSRVTGNGLIGTQVQVGNATSLNAFEDNEHERTFAPYVQEDFTTFDDKLLLQGSVRAERNSNNGSVNGYYTYPKAAGSYRLVDLFGRGSELKLRTAYGETGNQPLFSQKFTLLNTGTIAGIGTSNIGDGSIAASPSLKPERTREIEAGFDASFVQNRASLGFTWYRRRTSQLLLPRTPAPSSGFSEILENGGVLQNRGFELEGTLIPIQTRDFSWTFQTTWTTLRGTVEALPGGLSFRPAGAGFGLGYGEYLVQLGRPITQIIGYCGLDSGGNPKTCYLGQNNPDWDWTFANTFTLGNWTLAGLWDWRYGGVAENQTYS
ncbi:MAG TPA: SusC/RagA family TonB-linked outer membrane protein, partial [Gemmatimonadaceae bacterium]|nr:SusC/RagA family TonB-linked outer membrane protein [Gemmatimonadaceae bacterium]